MTEDRSINWLHEHIRIVRGNQLDLDTPQTPGMTRAAAITNSAAGAHKLWAGTICIEPNAKTGAHHHGELESIIYVISGRLRICWGDTLEFVEEAGPSDFIFVPPFVPHQEINPCNDEELICVVVGSCQNPVVINLDISPAEEPVDATWTNPIRNPARRTAVTIFSDGACSGNPGAGGWAALLKFADGTVREIGGFVANTTNNRMELHGAIQGLKSAGDNRPIIMITDSQYLRKGITEWIYNWKKRGWLTAAKKPVLNQDLWRQLDTLNNCDVKWEYTRGHAGNTGNERCDEIAHSFSQKRQPLLEEHPTEPNP